MESKKRPVHEFRECDGRMMLIRNKYPKFVVEIEDSCKDKELAAALKKAGEFVTKHRRIRDEGNK